MLSPLNFFWNPETGVAEQNGLTQTLRVHMLVLFFLQLNYKMLIFLSIVGGGEKQIMALGGALQITAAPGHPRAALLGRTRPDAACPAGLPHSPWGPGSRVRAGVPDSEAHGFLIHSPLRGQDGSFGFFPPSAATESQDRGPLRKTPPAPAEPVMGVRPRTSGCP